MVTLFDCLYLTIEKNYRQTLVRRCSFILYAIYFGYSIDNEICADYVREQMQPELFF